MKRVWLKLILFIMALLFFLWMIIGVLIPLVGIIFIITDPDLFIIPPLPSLVSLIQICLIILILIGITIFYFKSYIFTIKIIDKSEINNKDIYKILIYLSIYIITNSLIIFLYKI